VILACTVLIQPTSVTDRQTDRQTDRRPDDGKDARSILLSRVKILHNIQYNTRFYKKKPKEKKVDDIIMMI